MKPATELLSHLFHFLLLVIAIPCFDLRQLPNFITTTLAMVAVEQQAIATRLAAIGQQAAT